MKPIFESAKRIRGKAALSAVVLLLFSHPYPAAAQSGTFSATGSMSNARTIHTATLLGNGTVLMAGGFNPGVTSAYASAEIFNPNTGLFSPTGSLITARRAHAAALLNNGRVLIAGGRLPPTYFASAELYDPATGQFTSTGKMTTPRAFFTATLLTNGKVLVAGGLNAGVYVATAELYDPDTGFFAPTGSLTTARESHTATLLPDGRVLIVGGDIGATVFASAEIYNPDTGAFTPTGNLTTARSNHTATLLPPSTLMPRGKVLVAGGDSVGAGGPPAFGSAELYDPATGLFSATGSMIGAREFHTAILLPAYELRPHGKVLVAGGDSGSSSTGLLASAEVYDPDTGKFTATGSLTTPRENNTITLLPSGGVLIAGGGTSKTTFASAELYALPPTYTITDLGTLGGTFSQALMISNSGLIAGVASPTDGTQHAALWYHGQVGDISIPGLGGPNSLAWALNDAGQVVGQAETPTQDPNGEDFCAFGTNTVCLPFLWQNGAMTALPTLGGKNGLAMMINNHGEAIGTAEQSTVDPTCLKPQQHLFQAVLWGPKPGQSRQLSPLKGDTISMGLWINDNGQTVGTSGSCAAAFLPPLAGAVHAVLWEKDGSVTDIGSLGGTIDPTVPGSGNIGLYINSQGQVVGASELPGNKTSHAFLWNKGTGMLDIGTLPGDFSSAGLGISERGEIVGVSADASGNPRAFLLQNGVMMDLNTLIPAKSPLFLIEAGVINSRGEIAGFGMTSAGDMHGFLATPTSGPDTGEGGLAPAQDTGGPMFLHEDVRKMLQQRLRLGTSGRRFTRSR